jgi:hypothetical protein
MAELTFQMKGIAPLLFHNNRLADPLDTYSKAIKAISGKRKKTEEDLEEMARLEFLGSMYVNGQKEPVIPAKLIYGMLAGKGGAARKEKEGPAAKAGLFINGNFPLEFDGPKTPEALWEDERFRSREAVRIQSSTVIRTRPVFEEWAAKVTVEYAPDLISEDTLKRWVEVAGREVGVGDWRPQHGRFSVTFN